MEAITTPLKIADGYLDIGRFYRDSRRVDLRETDELE